MRSLRRQMALQVVDAMAPFAGAGIIDMANLLVICCNYGFGIKDAASFIQGPPPPQWVLEQGGPPQGGNANATGHATKCQGPCHHKVSQCHRVFRRRWLKVCHLTWVDYHARTIPPEVLAAINATDARWRWNATRNVTIKP
jgi:hypothetical protein